MTRSPSVLKNIDALEFQKVEQKVIYTFLRQMIESFDSILILLGNGHFRNSMIQLRSMYEHCVTMKYLTEIDARPSSPLRNRSSADSIQKFLDFYHVNRRKSSLN